MTQLGIKVPTGGDSEADECESPHPHPDAPNHHRSPFTGSRITDEC